MTRHDRIVADLMTALDAIQRADNIDLARGVAIQAMANCNEHRERNAYGYMVVTPDYCPACDREGASAGADITDSDNHTCGGQGEKLLFMAGWCAGFEEALTDDQFPEVDRSEVAWLQFLSERENG